MADEPGAAAMTRVAGASRALTRGLAVAGLLFVTGCDTLSDWFGSPEDEPLPGERISILSLDGSLEPDPNVADLPVRLPAPYVNSEWSQPGGSPTHAMYHLALGAPLVPMWSASVGEGSADGRKLLAEPLVVGDRVYTMDSRSIVSAFERQGGRLLWRSDLADDEDEDDGYFGGGIAFDADRLYATTGFAKVVALDAGSGEVLWRHSAPGPMRSGPAVSGGRVIALTVDNQAVALAAEDGRRLWNHSGIQETAGLLGGASPAIGGSTVIVPYSSGELFALLVETGRVLWNDSLIAIRRVDPIADLAHIRGDPVIDRGIVVAISHSGRMVAVDLRRGARAWEADLGGVQMPWVAGDFIYVITNDSQVICLTRRQGRIRWVRQLERFEDPDDLDEPIQWFGPVLAGDRLIATGTHGKAIAISPYTGELLGAIDLPGPPAVAPVVAQEQIFFLLQDATLVAMR